MSQLDQREEAVFEAALQLPAEQRAAYLDQTCAGDADLRRRVEVLLGAFDRAGGFLKQPAAPPRTLAFSLPPTEKPGDMIGRYKLLQQIGEGGCGVVYMAEQTEPVRRRVALKVIKLGMDTKQVIARFDAERQALAMMDHPNIAKIFDAGVTGTPVAAGVPPAVEPGVPPGGKGVDDSKHVEKSCASPGGKMPPSTAGGTPAATLSAGRPYFVMELVRGIKITDYCDQNNLSTEERLKLFTQVCHAIQHAHQKGIIHRDIKPSNILVTISEPGSPGCPKVIDFGIAKATSDQRLTDKTVFTAFEQFIGTPAYMSPEQAMMTSLDIDTRTDIYALGVLLYELLTGQTPFDAKELMAAGLDEIRRTIREVEPVKPSTRLTQELVAADVRRLHSKSQIRDPKSEEEVRASSRRLLQIKELVNLLRGDLDWIVMKCLEKDRNRRYETANGLAADIQRHLNCEPVIARPPSRLYEFQKTVRRHKFGFAAGAAVIMVLAVGVLASTWQAIRATRAEREQTRLLQLSETKEQKSEQVSQFLKDMLKGVEPSVALGRDTKLLKEILDKTVERVGKDLKNQPEVEAELLSTIGTTYFQLGEAQKAIEIHREALRLRRTLFGETNIFVAASLRGLGDALELANEFDNAESAHRESLTIRRQLLGNEHPDTALSLTHLAALLLRSEGKRREAEAALREALAIQRRMFPDGHEDLGESLDELGMALYGQGRLTEAEEIVREALALRIKLRGNENPEVATALYRLGLVLMSQGRLSEAEPVTREGFRLRRKFLGNAHPYVISALNTLADSLNRQGKFAEAETLLRTHLALRQTEPRSNTAKSLEFLATALLGQDKLSEAEGTHREALAMRQSLALKAADDSDASALNEAARFLATCDEATFRDGPRALQLAGKAAIATNRKDPTILDTLAAAYAEVGQFEKAVSVQQEAMGLLQDKNQAEDLASRLKLYVAHQPYPESRFNTRAADSLAAMVSSLLGQGKAAEAEKPARECLAIREQELPEDWRTFNTRCLLGGSLLGQKNYAEAEPLLLSGYEGMKEREDKIPANGKVRLKEALERLVQLYDETARPAEAAEWRQKLTEFENPKP